MTLTWWNTKNLPGKTILKFEDVKMADYDIIWAPTYGGDGGNKERHKVLLDSNQLNRIVIAFNSGKTLSKKETLEEKQVRTGANKPYVKSDENFVFYYDHIDGKGGEPSTKDEETQKKAVDEAFKLTATYHR